MGGSKLSCLLLGNGEDSGGEQTKYGLKRVREIIKVHRSLHLADE